jgi:hypothetical protein
MKKNMQTENITTEEYAFLEKIFCRISGKIDAPMSITTAIQEGFSLGVYDEFTGRIIRNITGFSIENCVSKFFEDEEPKTVL